MAAQGSKKGRDTKFRFILVHKLGGGSTHTTYPSRVTTTAPIITEVSSQTKIFKQVNDTIAV